MLSLQLSSSITKHSAVHTPDSGPQSENCMTTTSHDTSVATVLQSGSHSIQQPRIAGYHAHVYFNAQSLPQARALCEAAAQHFPLKMGRIHEKPVGPHPDW